MEMRENSLFLAVLGAMQTEPTGGGTNGEGHTMPVPLDRGE